METIEEKLLRYPDLTEDERREVDAYVDDHPEMAELRSEVQQLFALVEGAASLEHRPPDDEALAYYALTQYLTHHEPTPALQSLNERLESDIADSPELRERLQRIEGRLREMEKSSDARAHFEQLSGHSLGSAPAAKASSGRQGRTDRPPRARITSLRWMRYAAAAVVLVALGYAGLWLASEASESEFEELAVVPAEELTIEGYGLRLRGGGAGPAGMTDPGSGTESGEGTGADSLTAQLRYVRALDLIDRSRHTTLGLFPRYKQDRLRHAARLLREVIRQEEENSFLQLESYYFLGKTLLALERPEEAAAAFRAVVEGGGRKQAAAAEILQQLE